VGDLDGLEALRGFLFVKGFVGEHLPPLHVEHDDVLLFTVERLRILRAQTDTAGWRRGRFRQVG